jgi:cytochrome P450
MDRLFAKYGDMFTVNNPLYGREVVVSHPDLIKAVLTGSTDTFHGGDVNSALAPILGDSSILLLDGRAHHRERKLLMPPFHGERMASYGDVMRKATVDVIDAWPRGQRFSFLPSMQRITLDVILETVFGARDGRNIEALRRVLLALLERLQSPLGMLWLFPVFQRDLGPLTGWASLQRTLKAADDVIYAMIADARADGARPGNDILSMLLAAVDEEGNAMTDRELRDELITLLFAGHETTATALCWAIEEILRRPAVHERILAEVAAGGRDLPYLDATIKEILRLRPLAPLLVRKVAAPVTLGGHELPTGTVVVPCPYLAQRHPAYWDAPDELRPERFLGTRPDPYAWLPFGGGDRRCIGMAFALYEMRVVLSTLLPRVQLRLPDPPSKVTLRTFLFAPSGGPQVVVEASAEAA